MVFSSPSLPVAVASGEQMEAACSPPPALVLFMQTRGLDISGGGGEVKHLDQTHIQQQQPSVLLKNRYRLLTFLVIITRCNGENEKKIKKGKCSIGVGKRFLNIMDLNAILNRRNRWMIDGCVRLISFLLLGFRPQSEHVFC